MSFGRRPYGPDARRSLPLVDAFVRRFGRGKLGPDAPVHLPAHDTPALRMAVAIEKRSRARSGGRKTPAAARRRRRHEVRESRRRNRAR